MARHRRKLYDEDTNLILFISAAQKSEVLRTFSESIQHDVERKIQCVLRNAHLRTEKAHTFSQSNAWDVSSSDFLYSIRKPFLVNNRI